MDEMKMVRRLLDQPPPSRHVVEQGRERLLGGARTVPRTRTPRRAALRGVVALGLAGAAAAVVLLVASLVPGVSTPGGGGGPFVTEASARSVLLAAAVHAESAPASGTYWHVRWSSATTLPQRFGRGGNRYALEQLSVHEQWARRDGRAWSGLREWVRPKTAADAAAWRRDGAPRKWCTGMTDTRPPRPNCLHTAPGTASVAKDHFPFEVAEGHELTYAQLQRLPRDAGALRSRLVRMTRHDLDPSASAAVVDGNVTQILADLLVYPPVPPRVRAAAYRALASLPDVTSAGPTHDALGRAGIAIRVRYRGSWLVPGSTAAKRLTRTLIVDPVSSHVLADTARNGSRVLTARLVREAGWTDAKPRRPAAG